MAAEKKVLIIDDDAAITHLLENIVKSRGFQVVKEHNAEAGLESFKNNQPDLVLLDVMMPKTDGLTLCRMMRQESGRGYRPGIVLITAVYRSHAFRRDAMRSGADEVLVKPIDINAVDQVLKKFG